MLLTRIEPIQVIMPGRQRRVLGLAAFSVMGCLVAYAFPKTIELGTAVFPIMILAFIAGLSALWSP